MPKETVNEWNLPRSCKKVFFDNKNIFMAKSEHQVDQIDRESLLGFFNQENIEIKREFKRIVEKIHRKESAFLCRDILDFELLWSYNQEKKDNFLEEEKISGLHTILSVPISKFNYEKTKLPLKQQDKSSYYRVRLSVPEPVVSHDFSKGSLELLVSFEVECVQNMSEQNKCYLNFFTVTNVNQSKVQPFHQWVGNRTVIVEAVRAFEVMRFKKRVRIFYPGIYSLRTFNLRTLGSNELIQDFNTDEEFLVFAENIK